MNSNHYSDSPPKPLRSFAEKEAARLIYLVRAKEKPTNEDAWYYVRVRSAALVPFFLESVKTGLDLTHFGDVLLSGWGKEPSPEAVKHIQEKYG